MTTPLLQNVARLDSGGKIVGFRWGGHKESRPWCFVFVGFPSLFVAPSGEQLALRMCLRRTRPPTISRVFVPIFFYGQIVVVDVEPVGFRPRVIVVGRRVVAECMRISSQEYFHEKYPPENISTKSIPQMGYMQYAWSSHIAEYRSDCWSLPMRIE